jgi:hypothetical protein
VFAAFIASTVAECPNACSAHGKCGAYDMCTCFRNWMSNDCSERICQFGLAHVDTPKGDLDASSGRLTGPDTKVIVHSFMYPEGTTEQYPATKDVKGNVLTNTAHEYRECSNKGICDRSSGTCTCFEGYEGSACQRASCPTGPNGVCSGHGTCQSISEIADMDHGNYYKLWDEDVTMGCVCDGGYEGPDCSQRKCKYGVDPLYMDNNATTRYSNFTYQFYYQYGGTTDYALNGNYSIIFYDSYGEDWETDPIDWDAPCDTITTTLESIPNGVIPKGSVRCYKHQKSGLYVPVPSDDPITDVADGSKTMKIYNKYVLAFPENPGKLPQFRINKYLDGTRATLYTSEPTSTLDWHIYSNGYIGEDVDMVPDRCFGVSVKVSYSGAYYYLDDITTAEAKLLKTCLGDSNGKDTDNTEVYNWDYGSATIGTKLLNPHLIKLQDASQYKLPFRVNDIGTENLNNAIQDLPKTQLCNTNHGDPKRFGAATNGNGWCSNLNAPGFYAVVWYDSVADKFKLLTNGGFYYLNGANAGKNDFYVYTTKGHLQLVTPNAGVFSYVDGSTGIDYAPGAQFTSYYSNVLHLVNTTSSGNYWGDISCENNAVGSNGAYDCINKDDFVMILDPDTPANNPVYPNMYQVKRISNENKAWKSIYPAPKHETARLQMTLDYSLNGAFTFNGITTGANVGSNLGAVYKFYPDPTNAEGGYRYAGACSMRGLCNTDNGQCECFNSQCLDDCSCISKMSY